MGIRPPAEKSYQAMIQSIGKEVYLAPTPDRHDLIEHGLLEFPITRVQMVSGFPVRDLI
jgi:hypothetical protein